MSLDAGDLGEQKRDNAERETEQGESPSTDASSRSLLSAEGVQLHQDLRSVQSGFLNYHLPDGRLDPLSTGCHSVLVQRCP